MYRVAIVEDEEQERQHLTDYLGRYSDQFTIDTFASAVEFLTDYKPVYDIVFMDIEMPYVDGMSAAQSLRELDKEVCLVFVTNMAKYAVKGYEVSAFDFIVKPVGYPGFALKLDRVLRHLGARVDKSVLINSGRDKLRIGINDIFFVEIMGHKIVYHTSDGNIQSYGTLKSVEDLLDDKLFVRCNNCYLVNLRHVSAIEGGSVVVGDERLLISAPRKAQFEQALTDYICGIR